VGSFVALLGRWSWARLLVFLVFALLGLSQTRMVPWFAVVAAPIAALNFQDALARHLVAQPRLDSGWVAFAILGRLGTALAVLALLVFAWPGMLHGNPDDP